jgi:hypothetical protein
MAASVREGYALQVLDPPMPRTPENILAEMGTGTGRGIPGLICAAIGSLVAGRLSAGEWRAAWLTNRV